MLNLISIFNVFGYNSITSENKFRPWIMFYKTWSTVESSSLINYTSKVVTAIGWYQIDFFLMYSTFLLLYLSSFQLGKVTQKLVVFRKRKGGAQKLKLLMAEMKPIEALHTEDRRKIVNSMHNEEVSAVLHTSEKGRGRTKTLISCLKKRPGAIFCIAKKCETGKIRRGQVAKASTLLQSCNCS